MTSPNTRIPPERATPVTASSSLLDVAGGVHRQPVLSDPSAQANYPRRFGVGGLLDGAEALTNATLGLVVSVLAVWLLWPLFGWEATATQAGGVTALFWALSTVRGYLVRRLFRWLS